ncbi:MAG: GNAT family N-acetyltransferase [Ferruginibacter sp.]
MSAHLNWTFHSFPKLSVAQLYSILQLRAAVFVVEQNCVYQDLDNYDEQAYHLCAWDGTTLVAYCRILPPGLVYPDASIGRVISNINYRKLGIGKQLMEKAIFHSLQTFKDQCISISAQLYLLDFYSNLGFHFIGKPYLEDNIPHIKMRYTV